MVGTTGSCYIWQDFDILYLFVFGLRSFSEPQRTSVLFHDFPVSFKNNKKFIVNLTVFHIGRKASFILKKYFKPWTIGFCQRQDFSVGMSGNMTYSSDEVNFLVYRYLQESGNNFQLILYSKLLSSPSERGFLCETSYSNEKNPWGLIVLFVQVGTSLSVIWLST